MHVKKLTTITLIIAGLLHGTAPADPPADYYDTITDQTGVELKAELQRIISGQRGYTPVALSYDSGAARVALSNTVDNVDGTNVRLIYTNELRPAADWPTDQSQEHAWPQSRGTSVLPAKSDLHHLYLCDQGINSTRNNRLYGFVNESLADAVPNASGLPADQNYYLDDVWQTSPRHRGDVARAIFYVDTRYTDLSIVSRPDVPGTNQMGYLDDLLQWHFEDPVDDFERDRNDKAFSVQNNRNPYVDNPQWVTDVYISTSVSDGDAASVAFSDLAPTLIPRNLPTPMIHMTVSADTNEWDVGLIVIGFTGTVPNDSVEAAVYRDKDADGVIDPEDDLLGTNGFLNRETSIILAPAQRADQDGDVTLIVAADVDLNVPDGETISMTVPASGVYHSATGGEDPDPTNSAFTSSTSEVFRQAAGVFFSEYVEGNSNNKALEIYNGSNTQLIMNGWAVEVYFNGNTTPTTTINLLTQTIPPRDVFVMADNDAIQAILDRADFTWGQSSFNGNDAILLRDGEDAIVDVIGQIGFDPGAAGWGTTIKTTDTTLRRKPSVLLGDTSPDDAFDPALEWEALPIDTFDGLGAHTTDQPGASEVWVLF